MNQLLLAIQKNPIIMKYGLGFLTILMMIISIKTYLNYLAIETSIASVNEETMQITQRKNYEEKFLIAYEQSDYAEYFLLHENNILLPGEFIIRFDRRVIPKENTDIQPENMIQKPKDSWLHFFQTVKDKYK